MSDAQLIFLNAKMEHRVMPFVQKKLTIFSILCSIIGLGCGRLEPNMEINANHTVTMNQPSLIPLEDFFKNPEKTAYKLSPDGTYYAYLAPYENRQNIFVQKVGADETIRITSITDRDLSGFVWATDERLLYVRDFGGDENFHLFSVGVEGGEEKDLTPFEGVRVMLIDDLFEDEDHILVAMNKRNPQIFDPFHINIHTGELKMAAENPGNITEWITDHEGQIRVAIATDGVNNTILYRTNPTEGFTPVLTTDFRETVAPMYFDFDNGNIVYALSNRGRDKMAVIKLDMRTGEELEVIFEHDEVDVSYMSYSRKRKVFRSCYNKYKS